MRTLIEHGLPHHEKEGEGAAEADAVPVRADAVGHGSADAEGHAGAETSTDAQRLKDAQGRRTRAEEEEGDINELIADLVERYAAESAGDNAAAEEKDTSLLLKVEQCLYVCTSKASKLSAFVLVSK